MNNSDNNDNYENNEVNELSKQIRKNFKPINIKNISKISEKMVTLLYHNEKFKNIYYKKQTIDDSLQHLFIKPENSDEKNEKNAQILNNNNIYLNQLITNEKNKINKKLIKNRSSWKSFSSWFCEIFSKTC